MIEKKEPPETLARKKWDMSGTPKYKSKIVVRYAYLRRVDEIEFSGKPDTLEHDIIR
jgi:hypothetical protein